jgi:hypothetical protein
MSRQTVHSHLRSIKCLASWLVGRGHLGANPFLADNPHHKKLGVMPVLGADDRVPKMGSRRGSCSPGHGWHIGQSTDA